MKLTKIVATIGPSSDSPETIHRLIKEGVDVFRFNLKHGEIDWHRERIKMVNDVVKKLQLPVGIMLDLQGPEIRVNLPFEQIEVKAGQIYPFGDVIFKSNIAGISINYPQIIRDLKGGEKVLIEDGFYEFEVIKKNDQFYLLSKQDGVIKNKKNFNILGFSLPFSSFVEKDLKGLEMAARSEVDFIALSFVRDAKDIIILKKEMVKFGLRAKIIAKIETAEAIRNIDEIIEKSDGIMVARGDLGVQLPMEEIPYYQKIMIEKARKSNKFVITATQMLQSMIASRLPTRAEVSDVATACYDQTDAVMLSAETANGRYPIEAVKMMRKIIEFNEKKTNFKWNFSPFNLNEKEEIITKTVVDLVKGEEKIKDKFEAILVFTETGKTARLISINRPNLPIIAFVPERKIADSLTINYGIYPFVYAENLGKEIVLDSIKRAVSHFLKKTKLNFKSNNFIVIHGDFWRVKGKISTLRFFKINGN